MITELAEFAEVPPVRVKGMPRAMITSVGLFVPMVREIGETYYQFDAPYVLDDSATRSELGLLPTDWQVAISDHLQPFIGVRELDQQQAATLR